MFTRDLHPHPNPRPLPATFRHTPVNHSYDHRQRTLKNTNTQNGSKSTNHKSQTMTF